MMSLTDKMLAAARTVALIYIACVLLGILLELRRDFAPGMVVAKSPAVAVKEMGKTQHAPSLLVLRI